MNTDYYNNVMGNIANKEAEQSNAKFSFGFDETKKDWIEAFSAMRRLKTTKAMYVFFILSAVILVINGIVSDNKEVWASYIPVAFIIVFVLIIFYLYPRIMAKQQLKNEAAMGNTSPHTTITFGDKISLQSVNTKVDIEYSNITGYSESKNLYLISFGKNVFTYFPKTAIPENQKDEFDVFLKSVAKPFKKKKLSKILFSLGVVIQIITIILLIISYAFTSSEKSDYETYKNIDDKIACFYENKAQYNSISETIISEKHKDENELLGDEYYVDGCVFLVKTGHNQTIVFEKIDSINYFNGYVYYNGENELPSTYDMGYGDEDSLDLKDAVYIEEDDLYLKGSIVEDDDTSNSWLLIKSLGENWYYCEYHTKGFAID